MSSFAERHLRSCIYGLPHCYVCVAAMRAGDDEEAPSKKRKLKPKNKTRKKGK